MDKAFSLVSLCLSLCLFFCALFGLAPERLSEEDRAPRASASESLDGWLCGRLPLRCALLRFNRDAELLLGKNEYGGAFFGRGGVLFSEEVACAETLSENLRAISAFEARSALPVYTLLAGSELDILTEYTPRFYASEREELVEIFRQSNLTKVDVFPALRYAGGIGKYIYYRGDRHLTSLGAYYCYAALGVPLGYTPFGASDFSISVVSSAFSGSDARRLLVETKDTIALYRYRGDSALCVKNFDTGSTHQGLYFEEMLFGVDKYSVFLGGSAGRLEITGGESRPRLLIVRDSYASAVAPFLARHFDLDLVDLRYTDLSVQALTEENEYAAVLFLFGIDTLAGSEILCKLEM